MLSRMLLTGALLFAGSVSSAATVVLFDDSFEMDSQGVNNFETVTELTNWTVTQGNVDLLDASYSCIGCVDLDGTSGLVPAILKSNEVFTVLADTVYTITLFFTGGTEEEAVTVDFDGDTLEFVAGNGTTSASFDVVREAESTTNLRISVGGPVNNLGPYLDRVLITYESADIAPVPLPAGAPLLLVGLGALGLLSRGRRG